MGDKILIVGAGPTGLTAAVELARRGVPARIIEKRPGPSQLSRAVGILASSMEILERSGTRAPIEAEAVRFGGLVFHRGAEPWAEFPLNFDEKSRIWGLPQDRTEHHLAEALSRYGGAVEYGTPFEGLMQDDDGVEVAFGGQRERFDLVIGADGVRSGVRQALGIAYDGIDLPEDWSIADVEATGWRRPDWFQGFMLPGGDVAVVVPIGPARYRVIASEPDAIKAVPVEMPVSEVHRTAVFRISVRQVESYAHGRVYLAGDAAHCHSPVGGRGMNLGIADAAELAKRIVEGRLEGYSAARHPVGQQVIEMSERGRKMIQSRTATGRAMAAGMLWTASHVPPMRRAIMRALVSG